LTNTTTTLNRGTSILSHTDADRGTVDLFLGISGIKGELTGDHKGEIAIESFSWGVSNSAHASGGGGGAGKVSMRDFSFSTSVNRATPALLAAFAGGDTVDEAILKIVGDDNEFGTLSFELENVLVSSVAMDGEDDAVPTDSFSLNFTKVAPKFSLR
jgi:type VI secretion system secreted protein Hcp